MAGFIFISSHTFMPIFEYFWNAKFLEISCNSKLLRRNFKPEIFN